MADEDVPNDVPEPPEDIADYDLGSAQDAVGGDGGPSKVVWVADHEREVRWWFRLSERIPVRKKQKIVEENVTAKEDGINVDADYYVDMLELLIEEWSGEGDDDAPGLRELLTSAYRSNDPENPVFETLWDEVPPPFSNVPDADLNA